MANYFENDVKLIGNLGGKPEVKETSNGSMVTMQIATTNVSRWTDEQGQKQSKEKTTWHRVVSFNPAVTKFAAVLNKGEKVAIRGYLDSRKFGDAGAEKFITEVVALSLETVLPLQKAAE